MRTCLLAYFDARLSPLAEVAIPTFIDFARRNRIRLTLDSRDSFPDVVLRKVEFILECFSHNPRCDRWIYADIDCLFRPGALADRLFPGEFNLSVDEYFCAGFMSGAFSARVETLLQEWLAAGVSIEPNTGRRSDQLTLFSLLRGRYRHFARALPESLVSNARSPVAGLVAHHFWNFYHRTPADTAASMRAFDFAPQYT